MMKAVVRACCFVVVILPSLCYHDGRVVADLSPHDPTGQYTVQANEQVDNAQLIRRRGSQQRRLFAWGNLLYALHLCHGPGPICPKPHCDGPLKPPSCKSSSSGGGGGGGSSGGGSSSSSSSRSDGGSSSYSGGDGDANYVMDYQYNEASSEGGDVSGGSAENQVSDGVTNVTTANKVRSRFNMFWAFLSMAGVASLVGVFLMKKKKNQSAEDELDHQLSQSVSKRLEKLLDGKTVRPIHDDGAGPSFLEVGKKGALAASLEAQPEIKTYEEPDEEAIEMKLDDSQYVEMTT